jgi:hypothetical protein
VIPSHPVAAAAEDGATYTCAFTFTFTVDGAITTVVADEENNN